jgi:SAM-dependent methyltransferase
LDVPYVPTPQVVVDEMLKMANVTKDDKLYDLGCGDGRIVVTAAKNFGARGVGVDIDPQRIRESNENAREAGVTELTEFYVKDLFEMDFSDATVVTLYLLPDINVRLRPRLLNELRPGTRIVSHDFDMGDWKPDDMKNVRANRTHALYFWVIPAKVDGRWQWEADGHRYTLHLSQTYQELEGKHEWREQQTPIENGRVRGEHVEFTVRTHNRSGEPVTRKYSGKFADGRITGEFEQDGHKTAWNAQRF